MDVDKKVFAKRLGVDCYQLFEVDSGLDVYMRVVNFAVAELCVKGVVAFEGLCSQHLEDLRRYCVANDISFLVVSDCDFSYADSLFIFPHRCRLSNRNVKIKKLMKRGHELNGIVMVDISDTFEEFSIDIKGLKIDICVVNNVVVMADRVLNKSYKYIENKYFTN